MSVLDRIAYHQGRRDEVPNQELAKALVEKQDRQGIQVIAQNLWNENPEIQSDCLKVLYEIGYRQPELIARYVDDFLQLLKSRQNRLVWGGMIALSTIAVIQAEPIFAHVKEIQGAMDAGSVITRDSGVKVLAAVASVQQPYREAIFPYLLRHLETCRPKDVAQHAESILPAVDQTNFEAFNRVLDGRMTDLKSSQAVRVRKVMRAAEHHTRG